MIGRTNMCCIGFLREAMTLLQIRNTDTDTMLQQMLTLIG